MTKNQIKLLDELIADITISRVEPILDDMYPDTLADGEGESLQELVEYVSSEYGIEAGHTPIKHDGSMPGFEEVMRGLDTLTIRKGVK